MTELGQLAKYKRLGDALVEIQAERERQKARAPPLPTMLATIMNTHYQNRDEDAILQKVHAAAKVRAAPNPKKVPVTELEKLVADAPKTSAQVIGTHKVPSSVWMDKGPPKKLSQLEEMYKIFPRTTAGEAGFHHNFEQANAHDAKKASALMQTLSAKQVAADPQMAAALAKLKSHVVHVGRMHNSSGVQRGVQTRGGKKSL